MKTSSHAAASAVPFVTLLKTGFCPCRYSLPSVSSYPLNCPSSRPLSRADSHQVLLEEVEHARPRELGLRLVVRRHAHGGGPGLKAFVRRGRLVHEGVADALVYEALNVLVARGLEVGLQLLPRRWVGEAGHGVLLSEVALYGLGGEGGALKELAVDAVEGRAALDVGRRGERAQRERAAHAEADDANLWALLHLLEVRRRLADLLHRVRKIEIRHQVMRLRGGPEVGESAHRTRTRAGRSPHAMGVCYMRCARRRIAQDAWGAHGKWGVPVRGAPRYVGARTLR
eukprot:6179815-Pleurochrysis_carterae.AAC.2